MATWLTLQEYSNQQSVSISTLRRKIKNHDIEYTLKNGRYLLKVPSETDTNSGEEIKSHYKKILEKKEEEIQNLKQDKEDLLHLLSFLEKEKAELLEFIEDRDSFSV